MKKNKAALGIDIGGTNTVFGLVNEEGFVYSKSSIPTNGQNSSDELFKDYLMYLTMR